jgi:L-lysine 6-transaminase
VISPCPDTAKRDAFWKGCYELGLLVVRCGDHSIRLRPVLDVTPDVLEKSIAIMDQQAARL